VIGKRKKVEVAGKQSIPWASNLYMCSRPILSSKLRIAARSHGLEERADVFVPDELEEAWPSERFPRRTGTFEWAVCTVRVYYVASEVPNEFRLEKFPLCK